MQLSEHFFVFEVLKLKLRSPRFRQVHLRTALSPVVVQKSTHILEPLKLLTSESRPLCYQVENARQSLEVGRRTWFDLRCLSLPGRLLFLLYFTAKTLICFRVVSL